MTKYLKSASRLVFGVLAITACSGSPTGTNSGDALTDAEIQALLNELAETFGGIGVVPVASVQSGAVFSQSSEPISADFNESVPCESGSIVMAGSIDGDIDQQTLQGAFDVQFTWDFNSCVVTTETTSITVDGDPHIEFNGNFNLGENTFSVSGTEKGGFAFATTDGRSGSCAIDLSFDTTVNSLTNAVSGSFAGSVCGKSAAGFQTFGTS